MNIKLRKDELIKSLDLNIKYLKQIKATSKEELHKSLITLLTRIDKVRFTYLYTKLKYIIASSFNTELNNNYLTDLELKLAKLQEEFIKVTDAKTGEEEKAYLSYWFSKVMENHSLDKLINTLKLERDEIRLNKVSKRTLYDVGTLEEIDAYERKKHYDTDMALINKGLTKYQISLGYLSTPKEINKFIRELRTNFFNLIKQNKSVSLDNINILYNTAYEMTIKKFNTEPVTKLSMSRMLSYLRRNNKITIDSNNNIIETSALYQKYYNECMYLFTNVLANISYIDIEEVERLFNICCRNIGEEMNYTPERPISLKKVLPKSLKKVHEMKKQN